MNFEDVESELNNFKNKNFNNDVTDKNERFLSVLSNAHKNSIYYKELMHRSKVKVSNIESLNDIGLLPIIDDRIFIEKSNLLCIPEEKITRYCQASGSTGKPKLVPYTRLDINDAVAAQARSLMFSGVEKYDKGLCVMAYGPWASGLICQAAGEIFGLTIPAEAKLGMAYQLWAIEHYQPDYVICLPSFLPRLEMSCKEKRIDTKQLGIKKVLLVGEVFSPDFTKSYEESFGSTIVNMYANTEFGLVASACHLGKLHLWDDYFHAEVINPDSRLPCHDGDVGELVITALKREALPLIRYNTHDLVQAHQGECECGFLSTHFSEIKGRGDDMLSYSGGSIFPSRIENAVAAVEGLSGFYQCIVEKIERRDQFHFRLEAKEAVSNEERVFLQSSFFEKLIESDPVFKLIFLEYDLAAKPNIDIVPPGEISQWGGKMKKIIDRRSNHRW